MLLKEIGAVRAPGGVGHDQRILIAGDEAFVFVWAATTNQLKEILQRYGITASTEDDVRFRSATNIEHQLLQKSTRHQCHIYDGPATRGLAKMAAALIHKLDEGYRCLYLNSPELITEMAKYLEAAGTDVERELKKGSLLLSSDQSHLDDGNFEIDQMMDSLETAVTLAPREGYKGLWAVGDMAWEFGPVQNFVKLLNYERRLDELFRRQPTMSGVCQYHVGTVPRDALHDGLVSHSAIFVNETLARVNPLFFPGGSRAEVAAADRIKLDDFIAELSSTDNDPPR